MIAMPHRLSQIHTRSSLDVYKKSSVPVLGVVENMSLYLCPHCGRVDPVWGDGGIKALADEYKIPLLGSVPLMRAIRQSGDEGDPTAILDDHEKISHAFHEIVRKFTARLSRLGAVGRPG
jgi:ATP-binding protein involved in chromosome partitioning